MNCEEGSGRESWRPVGGELRILSPGGATQVDRSALVALRFALGDAFEERFEEAVFDTSERFSRIEIAVARGELEAAACGADELVERLALIGLAEPAAVARDLFEVCARSDATAAAAVCARLMRTGVEGMLLAAELSVELAEGA